MRHYGTKLREGCYFFVCDEELGCLNSRAAVPEGGHAHGGAPAPTAKLHTMYFYY